jgi:hypothetical protein
MRFILAILAVVSAVLYDTWAYTPLTIVVSPAAPAISCSLAPGSFFAIVGAQGTQAKHAVLVLTGDVWNGSSGDFILEKAHAPTYIEVGPGGIASGNCNSTQDVTVNATYGQTTITQDVSVTIGSSGALISMSPSSLNFGSEFVGSPTSPQAITVTNVGGATFTFASISLGGTNPGDFSRTNTCGSTLAPAANCTINVTFTPTTTGGRSATAVVTSAGVDGPYSTALSGSGVSVSAFYVATTGSDSNPGTLASPFATLTKCQTAMRASAGATLTCLVRGGTYTPTSAGAACSRPSAVLILTTPADDGETWSYYPPDGYNSAIINGQASGSSGLAEGVCSNASNLTIDGIFWENYQLYGIEIDSGSNVIVSNGEVSNITNSGATGTAGIVTQCMPNGQIVHNIVTNTVDLGIATFPTSNNCVDNLLIANNYVSGACSFWADCGGIYLENIAAQTQSGEVVEYNYVANNGGGGGGDLYYLDDGTSNVTLTGNVGRGTSGNYPFLNVHSGSNNTFRGNIADLSTQSGQQIIAAAYESPYTMSGNTWEDNLIVANAPSPAGSGYVCNVATCQLTLTPNGYNNYAGGNVTAAGSLGTDTGAIQGITPNFGCGWLYNLPSNSPVYAALPSFPVQPSGWGAAGFWGPPGFTIPRTGTVPSPPHAC